MPLTAAEQAEHDQIAAQLGQMQSEAKGDAHLSAVSDSVAANSPANGTDSGAISLATDVSGESAGGTILPPTPPADPSTAPFSLTRSIIGGVRDAVQGTIDFAGLASNALQRAVPLPGVVFGSSAKNGIIGFASPEQLEKAGHFQLPGAAPKDEGTPEAIVRGITSFVAPYTALSKAWGAARAASELGEAAEESGLMGHVLKNVAIMGVTEAVTQSPQQGNFADFIQKTTGISNPILQSLTTENDPDSLEARLKTAIADAPINLLGEAGQALAGKLVDMYRGWRGMETEASAIAKATEVAHGLPAGTMEETAEAAQAAAERQVAAEEAAKLPEAEAAEAQAEEAPEAIPQPNPERPFDPAKDVTNDNQPKSYQDVTDFLANKVGDLKVSDEELKALGEKLVDNPGSALKELGIDVKNLGEGELENPTAVGRLVAALRDIQTTIAQRLGRTGITVPENAVAIAARSFATSMDTVKSLFGSTENLAEKLTATRIISEANRVKLVASAQDALAALKAGLSGEAEWAKMSSDFFQHAYINGMVTGAKSEVGRALRSTQTTLQSIKAATVEAGEKAGAVGTTTVDHPEDAVENASTLLSHMTNPAERILFLQKLLDKAQDEGALSRWIRTKANSPIEWALAASKASVNNLWTVGTTVKILGSAISFTAVQTLSKAMVAFGHALLSPISGDQAFLMRTAFADLWGHVDGITQAYGTAWRSAWALMEKATTEELALNLNGLGLEDAAAKVAGASSDAASRVLDPTKFIRPDLPGTPDVTAGRAIQQAFDKWAADKDFHAIAGMGLRGLVRAAVAPLNAAGSLTRIGSLLVSAPDNFVAIMRQRAGAQSYAVQYAAKQAAEMGLTGKELSSYLKAKMIQLTETSTDAVAKGDPVIAGQRDAAYAQGTQDAQHLLFHDDPTTFIGKAVVGAFQNPLLNIFAPVVKTPTRILETFFGDFLNPLAPIQIAMKKAFVGQQQQAEEAAARLLIAYYGMYKAYQLADSYGVKRVIVGDDGGYKSSARLAGRPSMSIKVGGDVYDLSGIEPIGTILGAAADIKEYMDHNSHDPAAAGKATTLIGGAIMSILHVALDKSMLTELSSIAELADTSDPNSFDIKAAKYFGGLMSRYVPGEGITKGIQKMSGETPAISKNTPTAVLWDSFLKSTPFAGHYLQPVRDQLGYPVEALEGARVANYKFGPESTNPLRQEMARLAFDMPDPPPAVPMAARGVLGQQPDPLKVKMSGDQYSRFLELRGHIVGGPGNTMEDSLNRLIQDPSYKSAPYQQQVVLMKKTMEPYGRAAMGQLLTEDHALNSSVQRAASINVAILNGQTPQQGQANYEKLAASLGLPIQR